MGNKTYEIWKPVYGHEGIYEVSNIGRVKSLRSGLILKQQDLGMRLGVGLNNKGIKKMMYVHRLVLDAFVCPKPEGMICCHSDGDYRNNNVENLRWGTYSDNMQDAIRHGRRYINRGQKHGMTKLTDNDVSAIIAARQSGVGNKELAEKYGVCKNTIRNIYHKRTWKYFNQ